MHILLISLHLQIPQAQSLKDKRRQIKSLKDRIRSRFNASVAEVDKLEQHRQSVLAVCMIGNDKPWLEKQLSQLQDRVLEYAELELISIHREWL